MAEELFENTEHDGFSIYNSHFYLNVVRIKHFMYALESSVTEQTLEADLLFWIEEDDARSHLAAEIIKFARFFEKNDLFYLKVSSDGTIEEQVSVSSAECKRYREADSFPSIEYPPKAYAHALALLELNEHDQQELEEEEEDLSLFQKSTDKVNDAIMSWSLNRRTKLQCTNFEETLNALNEIKSITTGVDHKFDTLPPPLVLELGKNLSDNLSRAEKNTLYSKAAPLHKYCIVVISIDQGPGKIGYINMNPECQSDKVPSLGCRINIDPIAIRFMNSLMMVLRQPRILTVVLLGFIRESKLPEPFEKFKNVHQEFHHLTNILYTHMFKKPVIVVGRFGAIMDQLLSSGAFVVYHPKDGYSIAETIIEKSNNDSDDDAIDKLSSELSTLAIPK